MIKELAVTASIGVALKILTNLVMLPLLASYFKVDDNFVARAAKARETRMRLMQKFSNIANPRAAVGVVIVAVFCSSPPLFKAKTAMSGRCMPVRRNCAKRRAIIKTVARLPKNSRWG